MLVYSYKFCNVKFYSQSILNYLSFKTIPSNLAQLIQKWDLKQRPALKSAIGNNASLIKYLVPFECKLKPN